MPVKYPPEPKRWRVRGKAADGLVVTLGRYDTEEDAQADCRKFTEQAVYRNLEVQAIPPPAVAPPAAAPPPPPAAAPPARKRGRST